MVLISYGIKDVFSELIMIASASLNNQLVACFTARQILLTVSRTESKLQLL